MRGLALRFAIACALCSPALPAFAQSPQPAFATPAPASLQETPQATRPAIAPQATKPPTPRAEAPQPNGVSTLYDDVPNVRVEVTITHQVGQAPPVKRTAALVVASSIQDSGSLRAGNQVPVPSTTFVPMGQQPKSDGSTVAPAVGNPMTSWNYRAVGLNLDARRVSVSGNRTKMNLNIEFSAVDERTGEAAKGAGAGYPTFPTFSQALSVVLESGKPLVIAQATDVVDNVARKQSVEVVATILK